MYIKNIIYICFINERIGSLFNYYTMKQNVIIVGNNYQDFVDKAKEITKGYQVVWYERILFNEKFKFSKCKIDTQVIILRRVRSRNDIPRWFKLSKYSITVERRGYPLYLVYPKMVFNCPPNLFKLLPKRITANCKVIIINETN